MRDYGLDGGDSSVRSPDLQLNNASVSTAASITSKDSYSITIENLPVKLNGKYNFVFQYYYQNPDKTQSTPILGPSSATYSVSPTIEDLSTTPTNVTATGGFYSYQLKWDTPTFLSYGDTIVYESNSNSFNSSSKVVYVGTANQCTILTSDLISKYVYVVHRDMFLDANKKGLVVGPIVIQDPIEVDSAPPTNTFTVGTTTVQDDPDGLFTFNKKILFTWTENTDVSTYGYQIRFRRLGTTDYTYMSAPGKSTISTYLYGVKAGQTYEIAITTYDQFGNINTSDWKSYSNIVIPASTSLQADVAITAGDMKLGYGIGGDNANKGLYLGPENYWYIQGNTTASSAARLSVGGTNDKMVWDGTNLAITGNLTARAGTFTGNILMATSNASIYNGTINSSGNLTGNGFALNSTGLKVANGTNSVTIDAANGRIIANAGTIGGWSLTDTLLNQNNARLSSTGYIELGGASTDNIIRIDANDTTYRMWIGRNSSATAPFKVTKEGALYASGATITGSSTFSGTLSVSSALSDGGTIGDVKTTAGSAATAASNAQTTANSAATSASNAQTAANLAATEANTAKVSAAAAKAIADAALPSTSFNRDAIVNSINSTATTTTIDGGKLTTGTVSANAVVSDFISTFSLNADKITTGTLTGRDISIAGDTSTNRFRTSYDRNTPVTATTVSSLGINAIAMISVNTSGVVSHWYPYLDAESDIGTSTYKWRFIRSNNGTIQTSDIRKKTNILDSDLGLNFINLLRPVKYNNKYDPKAPELDENNQPILDENGNRVVKPGQEYTGSRYHYGFIAQEVKVALDQIGIGDTFSGWTLDDINDETSYQGLSYDKFIAPMAKAIQELSNMVELLQEEVNTLKGI
jgi:hypothetical protein